MESKTLDAKYLKLATEYSKIRAQANILKKAVVEEQHKNSQLHDLFRQKETSYRRVEQEVDSLSFRNKQLEHRVASLQEDIAKSSKKSGKTVKNTNRADKSSINDTIANSLIAEELQKKILENAQLTSLIDDQNREIKMQNERINELETQKSKYFKENEELERSLRKEIDSLKTKNSELETKLVEVGSTVGSEDALSAFESENTPIQINYSNEEKIAYLEKEVFHWKAQYEILKITDTSPFEKNKDKFPNSSSYSENKLDTSSKQNLLYDYYSKKYEELLRCKYLAESKLTSYILECENLQNCLESAEIQMKDTVELLEEFKKKFKSSEEDLATTRINYEEQISVLTEQVISLSEQLASLK